MMDDGERWMPFAYPLTHTPKIHRISRGNNCLMIVCTNSPPALTPLTLHPLPYYL